MDESKFCVKWLNKWDQAENEGKAANVQRITLKDLLTPGKK